MKRLWPMLSALFWLAGCEAQLPFPTPPPLQPEILPLPPVSATPLVWQPGDWAYTGGSYRYDAGQYVPAAGHSLDWVFGHWQPLEQGPVWVPGHWL